MSEQTMETGTHTSASNGDALLVVDVMSLRLAPGDARPEQQNEAKAAGPDHPDGVLGHEAAES